MVLACNLYGRALDFGDSRRKGVSGFFFFSFQFWMGCMRGWRLVDLIPTSYATYFPFYFFHIHTEVADCFIGRVFISLSCLVLFCSAFSLWDGRICLWDGFRKTGHQGYGGIVYLDRFFWREYK